MKSEIRNLSGGPMPRQQQPARGSHAYAILADCFVRQVRLRIASLTIAVLRVTMVTNKAETSGELPMSTAPTVVSLNQIGQIAVTIYDLDRAVKFYHGVLGMK